MTQARARLWVSLVLAITLGAALRLWFVAHAPTISGDAFIYGDIALSWLNHGIYGFSRPPFDPVPTLIRLPGYPLFLVFCFRIFGQEHYTAVLFVQVAIDLAASLLLAALSRRLFGSRAATLALFLAALCPFTASYAAAALTETLTLATITVAFYALERWRPHEGIRAGNQDPWNTPDPSSPASPWNPWKNPWNRWLWILSAAVGCSILLRPEQGLLAAAILPTILWISLRHPPRIPSDSPGPHSATHSAPAQPPAPASARSYLRRAAPALAAAVCILLPLLPWTIRNARTFHTFQPLAPRSATDPGDHIASGFDLWYRTWGVDFTSTEDIYWNYDGAPIQLTDLPSRAFDSPAQFTATADLLRDYNLTTRPSPELEARFREIAEQRIHAGPVRYYLLLPTARLLNMLLRPRVEMLPISLAWWRYHEHPHETVFALAYATLNLAYLVAGTLGLARWIRRPNDPTRVIALAMIAFTLLRCALLLTLDNSEPRYTLELFPILITGIAALLAPKISPS